MVGGGGSQEKEEGYGGNGEALNHTILFMGTDVVTGWGVGRGRRWGGEGVLC